MRPSLHHDSLLRFVKCAWANHLHSILLSDVLLATIIRKAGGNSLKGVG